MSKAPCTGFDYTIYTVSNATFIIAMKRKQYNQLLIRLVHVINVSVQDAIISTMIHCTPDTDRGIERVDKWRESESSVKAVHIITQIIMMMVMMRDRGAVGRKLPNCVKT